MNPRGTALVLALAIAAPACRRSQETTASETSDAERQKVLRFWERYNAATAARIDHDCRKAAELYQEALALNPRHEDCLYYLGQCRRDLGQPAQAREAFDRLVDVNPASARGHLALAALLASPEAKEPLDLPRAEAHLRRAHEINGEETGPMVHLGEVLIVEGKPAEAREWFESALRTNPKSVEAAFLAGYLAWESGDDRAAGSFAQRARDAARIDAPVKGVLNEGDRKDAKRIIAPPLARPMGRLFFGETAAFVREAAREGRRAGDAEFVAAWRSVRKTRRDCERRVPRG
jgi:tetratricopeptide (TPR) repeat protein